MRKKDDAHSLVFKCSKKGQSVCEKNNSKNETEHKTCFRSARVKQTISGKISVLNESNLES